LETSSSVLSIAKKQIVFIENPLWLCSTVVKINAASVHAQQSRNICALAD
jgi:hypothetical protein